MLYLLIYNYLRSKKAQIFRTLRNLLFHKYVLFLQASLTIVLCHEIVFKLIYKNYVLLDNTYVITASILLIFITIILIEKYNKRMDKYLLWDKSMFKKAVKFYFSNLFIVLSTFYLGRWIYFLLWFDGIVTLRDEMVVLFLILLFTLFPTLIRLSVHLLKKWRFSLAEIERFKKENAEFRFDMLKNQVNPHFLFNSLNTLSGLVYQDADQASEYTRQMAKVYRYLLDNREKETVLLSEELQFLESFKYLLELRFSNRLIFKMDITLDVNNFLIAPISLQLLVENAVKHNIFSQKRQLSIEIFNEGSNYLVVQNNLQLKETPENSTQIGLKNIKNRYAYLTDKPVIITQSEDYFTVKIPLIQTEEKLPK